MDFVHSVVQHITRIGIEVSPRDTLLLRVIWTVLIDAWEFWALIYIILYLYR